MRRPTGEKIVNYNINNTMKAINVYIICSDHGNGIVYGIGTYINQLKEALKCNDINLVIIHLHSNKPFVELEKDNGVMNLYVPLPNGITFSLMNYDFQLQERYFENVIYLLRDYIEDTTNLIFHINFNKSHTLVKGLKSNFDCRIIVAVHYLEWVQLLLNNRRKLTAILEKSQDKRDLLETRISRSFFLENELFHCVDHILSLSSDTCNVLHTEYGVDPEKISLIYNGLSDPSYHFAEDLRKKWGVRNDEFIILFVGRLTEEKGLKYLINAFHEVVYQFPDCRLMVAGNGDFDSYLKEARGNYTKITFTGKLDKEELYELYSIADIGVMPSFHEQCSYVAIEMMMHGIPLIANASTGLKEMIIEGETGFHMHVIEYKDSVGLDVSFLSEKIIYLLRNPLRRTQIAVNSRKRYEEFYTVESMGMNMVDLYKKINNPENRTIISLK